MAQFSKFLNVNKDVLVEWVFDNNNFITENYQVLSNLNDNTRSFLSTQNLNKIQNTVFAVDEVVKRYTKVDLSQFNFLQKQTYTSTSVPYDTVRLNFPTTFNFEEEGYLGIVIKIYTYDFYDKKIVPISTYFYDDQDVTRQKQIQLRNPFLYNSKEWSKYIELLIPNLQFVANQRVTNNDGSNYPIDNTINYELTNGIGISMNAPIFIDFSFIISEETRFGIKYFVLGDTFKTSIPKVPEYQDLSAEIIESTQGDFFEIYGKWGGTNQSFDDFIENLESAGQRIRIEYDVSLYEENILQRTQTFVVTENFSQKIIYRPTITFSNTTAMIDVTMKIIDVINESLINRKASIGLIGNNLLKYGARLSRINLDNAVKPKIYNLKVSNQGTNKLIDNNRGTGFVGLTRVSYPVITDRFQIVVSNNNTINRGYKSNGLLEIIITPFDTVMKFVIAEKINENGDAQPYDLTDISQNSKIKLFFKSQGKSLEKDIFYESPDNDFKNGVVVFKIEEDDINILKQIYQDDKNFFIVISNDDTGSKTMLYSGKYIFYEDVRFIDLTTGIGAGEGQSEVVSGSDVQFGGSIGDGFGSELGDDGSTTDLTLTQNQESISSDETSQAETRQNLLVYLLKKQN